MSNEENNLNGEPAKENSQVSRRLTPRERKLLEDFDNLLSRFRMATESVERERIYSREGLGHAYGIEALGNMAKKRDEAAKDVRVAYLKLLRESDTEQ